MIGRRECAHLFLGPLLLGLVLAAGCGTPNTEPGLTSSPAASGSTASGLSASWVPGPEAPVALIEQATTAHAGRIWTAGGLTSAGAAVDRVAILDPATGAWTDGPALPERMHHAALVSDGTDLWLVGGFVGDSFEQPTDAVWRLPGADPGGTWAPGPVLPERRAAGAAAWDGTRIVYGGGVGPSVVSDVVYTGGPDGFTPLTRLSRAREHLAAASDGAGRTWFLGGRRNGLAGNLTRVDLLDGDQVTDIGELSRARGGVAAFYWPSLGACLSGGEAPSEAYRDVECMTAEGQKASLPPLAEPRHGHGAAVIDGTAYAVFGGHVPALAVSSTVEVLDLAD